VNSRCGDNQPLTDQGKKHYQRVLEMVLTFPCQTIFDNWH
jgi:hypothetical protein